MSVRTAPPETLLYGGDVTTGVVRVGDTVRRPSRPSSPAVQALLRHLAAVGFTGAPRFLGVDEQGRQVLSYIQGEVPSRPLPAYAVTDDALADLAVLLRRFHAAAAVFTPPPGAVWEAGSNDDGPAELVGHCDVTPGNVVFRDGSPVALIDFDLARPATRLYDIATTLRHWAPIADPIDRDPRQRHADVGARLRLFCDAYGLGRRERGRLLETARLRFGRSFAAMRDRARAEGGGWARMWESGAGDRIRRAAAWLNANWDDLDARLR